MGTWGTGVIHDDYAADIVGDFFDLYNNGAEVGKIRESLEKSYRDDTQDNGYLFWLALAKAQWDVGALDTDVLNKVRGIVEEKTDAQAWKNLGATEKDILKREKSIQNFLEKISTPKEKPKKRVRIRLVDSPYEAGDVLAFQMENGFWGAIIVVDAQKQTQFGLTGLVTLHINNPSPPTIAEVSKCNVLHQNRGQFKNSISAYYFYLFGYKDSPLFKKIGRIAIKKVPSINSYAGSWSSIIKYAQMEFEYEKMNGLPKQAQTLKSYLGYHSLQKMNIEEDT